MDSLQSESFAFYWDDTAKAPYMYSLIKKQMITWDDERSIMLKTKYAVDHKLNGIMFWQLADDKTNGGLLDAIYKVLND
jgi:chitinase